MPRYIDADWITQKLEGWQDKLAETYGWNDEYILCLGEVLMKIDDTPTADVRENIHAHWEEVPHSRQTKRCSNCHNYLNMSGVNAGRGDADFCPNCGARMNGERMVEDG